MARAKGRTATCDRADARDRLRRAEEFLGVARLVLGESLGADDDELNLSGVSAALAVLAGIAAADAATCLRLHERARGQDHRDAVRLLRTVEPGGAELARDLDRLLDLKDAAHYGILGVVEGDARRALEWASRMVDGVRAIDG